MGPELVVRKRFRDWFVVFGIVAIYLDVYHDYLYALLVKGIGKTVLLSKRRQTTLKHKKNKIIFLSYFFFLSFL